MSELVRGFLSLSDGEARAAFLHTLRAVIDPRGQRVSGNDRLYLAESLPTLLVWGERDTITPLWQGQRLAQWLPSSKLVVLPGIGHLPQAESPPAFQAALLAFLK